MKRIIIIICLVGTLAFTFVKRTSKDRDFVSGLSKPLPSQSESMLQNPLVKYVTLSEDINLEYAETGETNGIPVIFLHGYSDSWKSFQPVLPYLPSSIHAFYLSQRGHGNSSKPLSGYHPKDFAKDVSDFMKVWNIKAAIIVGHSMGGTVAQRFALDFPEKTKGLILIGSFPSFRNNAPVKELRDYVDNMNASVDTGFVKEFQKSTIVKAIPANYFDTVISESLKVPAHVWKGVSTDLLNTDFARELKCINKPTLIIWGNKDSFCQLHDKNSLLNAIPGSSLKAYEGIGHAVHWEEPERFASDLMTFIKAIK